MEENYTQQPVQPEQPTYEQQVYQQPLYSSKPPVITPYNGDQNKKGKGMIITIISVAVIALLTLGVIMAYRLLCQSPKLRLTKGFANMAAELGSYASLASGDMDLQTIAQNMQKESITSDVVMNVTVGDEDTIGVDYTIDYDYVGKKMDTEISVSAFNIDLIKGRVAANGNRLFISLPELMQDTYYVETDTLGSDYNRSVWPSLLGYDMTEDVSFDMFPEIKEEDSSALYESISKVLSEDYTELLDTMHVEDSNDVVEIERDGKTIKCSGVRVTFREKEMNTLIEDLYIEYAKRDPLSDMTDALRIRFAEDVVLTVYFDGKGRIVNISTPQKIQLENTDYTKVGFSFIFDGSQRSLDHMNGTVKLQNEEESLKVDVERDASVTEREYDNEIKVKLSDSDSDYVMNIMYQNTWDIKNQEFDVNVSVKDPEMDYQCKLRGDLTDIEKGRSFTVNIGNLELLENGQRLYHISGSVAIRPLEGTISIPEDGKELFGLSEDEAVNLVTEIYTSLLGSFSGM